MNTIFHVILTFVQAVLTVMVITWMIVLLGLFGQGIIDVSNHDYGIGILFVVTVVLSPWLLKAINSLWETVTGWKRQLV